MAFEASQEKKTNQLEFPESEYGEVAKGMPENVDGETAGHRAGGKAPEDPPKSLLL